MEQQAWDLIIQQGGLAGVAFAALFIIFQIYRMTFAKIIDVIEDNTKAVTELTTLVKDWNGRTRK